MSTDGAKVLLIEDEREIRRFLRVALESHGYRLVEALTGKDGLLQAATQQPELVILDLGLPDMDGMDLIGQIRAWSKLPIVVLSARGHDRQKIDALDAGADDYLTKPFSVDELLARMRIARCAVQSTRGHPAMRYSSSRICESIWRGGRCLSAAGNCISRRSSTGC